jgi:flagellar biogenesis protein FliO
MLQQIFAILLVLGLLVATLALLRKRGLAQFSSPFGRVSNRSKEICVLERIGLDAQHALFLVNVRQETFLIGTSPSGCNRIATLPGQEQEA